jgi:crossover junction endodeoxyribonuclease RuvC
MTKRETRVLGVDTSLRSTGVAVVETKGNAMKAVKFGIIKVPAKARHSQCLSQISAGVSELIDRTKPDVIAIEGAFYCDNIKTAMVLGEARGAVIAACAAKGVPVYEYAPRHVKQAVVGFGGASKGQVRKMVMKLLGLTREPQEDEGDALALAICHLHNRTNLPALMPEEI